MNNYNPPVGRRSDRQKGNEMKKAWLNYSTDTRQWIIRLWIDDEWVTSKAFMTSHKDEETGCQLVSDELICELAYLQDLGYSLKITV